MIVGGIFIGMAVLGKDFIDQWVGDGFEPAYVCALLITFPSVIESTLHIADTTVV